MFMIFTMFCAKIKWVSINIRRLLFIWIACILFASASDANEDIGNGGGECSIVDGSNPKDNKECTTNVAEKNHIELNQDDDSNKRNVCRLYYAPRNKLADGEKGWGVFVGASTTIGKGVPILHPDIIFQVNDVNDNSDEWKQLIGEYGWDGQFTGGQYEGKKVTSIIPGVGMMAQQPLSTIDTKMKNIIPYRPDVDEGDLPRTEQPGSGSISHYYNYSFYANQPLPQGTEIFVHNNQNENFQQNSNNKGKDYTKNEIETKQKYSLEWLQKNGYCLDNLKMVRKSTNPQAGRGAVATRFLPKGSIIAPVPLIPIFNQTTAMTYSFVTSDKNKQKREKHTRKQLLMNYCFGHEKSSLLLFPYAPIVNFINHNNEHPNAVLRWSSSSKIIKPTSIEHDFLQQQIHDNKWMLEYVATRDILPGEEIFIDYGPQWVNAWNQHEASWTSHSDPGTYTPSYVMDEVASRIRTKKEQEDHPYADNLQTSCFYHLTQDAIISSQDDKTATIPWEMTRATFDFSNLRPCDILDRQAISSSNKNHQHLYMVRIKNRYGLRENQKKIPKGHVLIVNKVPRQAIRFTDRLYTTDQHLSNTFRHFIGLPNDIFPEEWKDLE